MKENKFLVLEKHTSTYFSSCNNCKYKSSCTRQKYSGCNAFVDKKYGINN